MKRYAVIAAVVLLAACGSASTDVVYGKTASRDCLVKDGVRIGPVPESDFVGQSATGGAFHAILPDNDVTVSFGLTIADADNIDQAYRTFHARNVGIDDVLHTQGSAVMLWHVHPTDEDIATVTGCLKK